MSLTVDVEEIYHDLWPPGEDKILQYYDYKLPRGTFISLMWAQYSKSEIPQLLILRVALPMKIRCDKPRRPPYLELEYSRNLGKYWDFIGEQGVNCKQVRPTITNIYDKKRCFDYFQKWIDSSQTRKVLKYDLFNEAGWTQFSFYFMKQGIHVYFVELSQVIAKKARKKIESSGLSGYAHIVIGDFRTLPFRDDAFDGTCSLDSITYVPEWEECLHEQVRVTRPAGRVIVMVPNIHNIFLGNIFLLLFDKIGFLQRESYYSFALSWKDLRTKAKNASLDVLNISGFSLAIPQLSWFDRLSERDRNAKSSFTRGLLRLKDLILMIMEQFFYRIEQKQTRLNLLASSIIITGQKAECAHT